MPLDRRQFVSLASVLLGTPLSAVANNAGDPLFLSAASDSDDRHWVMGFRADAGAAVPVFRHQLPARAHHIAVNKALGIYVVVARRPGTYLWIGDLATGAPLAQLTVPANRHLFGHGVFSADGAVFYATESDYQDMAGDSGRVSVWTVNRDGDDVGFMRQKEIATYGVGPHELLLKPDQQTLVVANGGIRTHPDHDRDMLNVDTMQPSLAYVNTGSGKLLERQALAAEYHQASIRHLDQNAAGQVAMGMQYEGEPFDRVPLVALHRQGGELQSLWAPEPEQGQMTQYVGAIRYDASGRFVAASCPRGNMITFWDADSGAMLNAIRSRDGCGVCATRDGFLVTTGTGRLSLVDLARDSIADLDAGAIGKVFWDNHLSVLEG